MSACTARHDLTRNVLVCNRETGHEGMHRDNGQNLYWHPGAPPLERVELPPARSERDRAWDGAMDGGRLG